MVELDDLKSTWSKSTAAREAELLGVSEISLLMKNKSSSIIERMKRNVLAEILVSVLCMFVIAYIPFIYRNTTITTICGLVVVFIFIPYFIYYTKKYLELKRFSSYPENIKQHLSALIQQIEHYLKIYFWGSLFLTPVSVFLGGIVLLNELKTSGILLYFDLFNIGTLSLLVCASMVATLVSYPLLKWYIHKLYGKPLDLLKINLKELQAVVILFIVQTTIIATFLCTNPDDHHSAYMHPHSATKTETCLPDSCSHNTSWWILIDPLQKWFSNQMRIRP